jgi:hypothetical protein
MIENVREVLGFQIVRRFGEAGDIGKIVSFFRLEEISTF